MSLSTALSIAQNSLLNTQRQTGVLSRNIAEAKNADYSRRSAVLSSTVPGSRVAVIQRATDNALFRQNLSALSGWTAQQAIVEGLDRLSLNVNGVDNNSSPAMLIGKLQTALQLYSSTPSNRTLAENALEMSRDVVRSLNASSAEVQAFRTDMDNQIASGVAELNSLLADFKVVNDDITRGARSGQEALDSYDARDAILKKISALVPISTIARADNDLMIVTADGATLFETDPRVVSFVPTPAYGPSVQGNRIHVDGVPLSRANGANTSAGGALAAMSQLRDVYAVEMQNQLDEIARGLIEAFSEPNSAPLTGNQPGLFTWAGAPNMPAGGDLVGLAGRISLSSEVDPTKPGGRVEKLRDGIWNHVNTDNNASFSDRLIELVNALDAPRSFTAAGGAPANESLMTYTSASISWMEDARKTAAGAAETKGALMFRTTEVLSNITNVNVDEEMSLMLELEQSYAASAKILQMIDEMLKTLLSVVR